MREKKLWLIITFHTTTAAMAMEAMCAAKNLPGRLIPVPREITAGCGMSWRAGRKPREACFYGGGGGHSRGRNV